ncbi:Cysteine dioxygenase [Bulinus truncatus]|nr:Cysteine dioxygenase [Bulinus truncatus]
MENGKWKTITCIDQLVEKLKELEDYNDVPKLLQGTSHLDSGWQEYAFWSDKESYSRNLIHEEKDKFQLFLICWQPGKGNDPHKHLDSRCFFKVLYGKIVEKFHREVKSDLSQKTDKEYETGEVCDMGDCKDFHSITNPIKHSRAVTLHVYIKPTAQNIVYMKDGNTAINLKFISKGGNLIEPGYLPWDYDASKECRPTCQPQVD